MRTINFNCQPVRLADLPVKTGFMIYSSIHLYIIESKKRFYCRCLQATTFNDLDFLVFDDLHLTGQELNFNPNILVVPATYSAGFVHPIDFKFLTTQDERTQKAERLPR